MVHTLYIVYCMPHKTLLCLGLVSLVCSLCRSDGLVRVGGRSVGGWPGGVEERRGGSDLLVRMRLSLMVLFLASSSWQSQDDERTGVNRLDQEVKQEQEEVKQEQEEVKPAFQPFQVGGDLDILKALFPMNSSRRDDRPSYFQMGPNLPGDSGPVLDDMVLDIGDPVPEDAGFDGARGEEGGGLGGAEGGACYSETSCTSSCGDGFLLLLPNIQAEGCESSVLQVLHTI